MPGKIVLIGMAPSKTGDPNEPLSGRSGKKLATLFGLSEAHYKRGFERINLLNEWPGPSPNGKGDAVPKARLELAAQWIVKDLADRKVVFLGQAVADAFAPLGRTLQRLSQGDWLDLRECYVLDGGGVEFKAAKVPHPSGVNHWWNVENEVRATAFLRGLLLKSSTTVCAALGIPTDHEITTT